MKIIHTLLALAVVAVIGLASCDTIGKIQEAVPVVNNRNPDGTFTDTPACPKCGEQFDRYATIYNHTSADGSQHYGVTGYVGGKKVTSGPAAPKLMSQRK